MINKISCLKIEGWEKKKKNEDDNWMLFLTKYMLCIELEKERAIKPFFQDFGKVDQT